MKLLPICLLFIFSISCSGKKVQKQPTVNPKLWEVLFFDLGDQELTVYNEGDSIVLKTWDYKTEMTEKGQVWTPINIRTKTNRLNVAEEDSIYNWTSAIVKSPTMPVNFCTDYVGSLKVSITYSRLPKVIQSSEFGSICEWRIISKETDKMHKLFKAKFEELK